MKLIAEGLPVVSGIANGPARVVKKTKQDESFEGVFMESDILVALSTLPEWEVLFPKAKAILTQEGGFASHAAQVAPVYKKPCIIGIDGLMERVSTGDIILVDANEGKVFLI